MKSFACTLLLSVLLLFNVAAAEYTPPSKFAVIVGSDNAPIDLYIYTSLTCSHCATCHAVTLPKIKTKYVDTGQVRLIIEPFPMEMYGSMAALVIGSLPQANRYEAMSKLFVQQKAWIGDQYVKKISEICGINPAVAQKLFDDKQNRSALMDARMYAQTKLKVIATPTAIINGTMSKDPSLKEIEKIIVEALKAKSAV